MSGFVPLPPTIIHSTTRISHADALAQLQAFLEKANNDAAYRPDSTLSERGPLSSSTTANTDLTLHHLNRIKLGLQGKNLGVEDLEKGFLGGARKRKRDGEDSVPATPRQEGKAQSRRQVVADLNEDFTSNAPVVIATQQSENDWQDKDDYELAQEDEDVDMHNAQRDPGAGLPQPADAEEEDEMMEIEVEETGEKVQPGANRGRKGGREDKKAPKKAVEEDDGSQVMSKEERKRRKKERALEDKRKREAEKLKKS